MLKLFLIRLTRKVLYIVFALLIAFAILVSGVRALTPILNHHYQYLENWTSKFLGRPVKIGHLKAWWDGYHPDLQLQDVTVYNSDKKTIILHINELNIDIALIDSLLTKQIKPSEIKIYGVKLHINGGLQNNSGDEQFGGLKSNDVLAWVFAQPRLTLRDINIDWQISKDICSKFILQKLIFYTKGDDHFVTGKIGLPNNLNSWVYFHSHLQGDPKNFHDLAINSYLKLNNFDFVQWFNQAQINNFQVNSGLLNGQFWLAWKNGSWSSIQSILDAKNIDLEIIQKEQSPTQTMDQVRGTGSGEIKINNLSGNFLLQSVVQGWRLSTNSNIVFNVNNLFSQPMQINKVIGSVQWNKRKDNSWVVTSDDFNLRNNDAVLDGRFALLFPEDDKAHSVISLLAGFDLKDSRAINKYLPLGIFHKNLVTWLNEAFIKGEGASGKVILRGRLDKFPYDDNEGTFIIDSEVRNTDLHYAENWPDIKNINAHLVFNGHKMSCDASSGQIYGAQMKSTHVVIPYIGEKPVVIKINGVAEGDANDLLSYIKDSPLNNRFGSNLSDIKMHGDSLVNLNITLPLEKLTALKMTGFAKFNQAALDMPAWNLFINQLDGKLEFNENDFWSKKIIGKLLNNEVSMQLSTIKLPKQLKFTRVMIYGAVSSKEIADYFKWPELAFLQGKTNYVADLDLMTEKNDKRQSSLSVLSDLHGLSSDLPQPFHKLAKDNKALQMQVIFSKNKQTNARLMIGDDLKAIMQFKNKKGKSFLYSSNIHFGEGDANIQKLPGLYIDGFLPDLNVKAWQEYLQNSKSAGLKKDNTFFSSEFKKQLRAVHLDIGHTLFLQQKFVDTIININQPQKDWLIEVINPDVNGTILIPDNFPKEALQANFKRLNLQKIKASNTAKNKITINPNSIPPLNIVSDNFFYGNKYFGKLDLFVYPKGESLQIKHLKIDGPLFSTELSGYWKKLSNGQYSSRVNGEFFGKDINEMLKEIDVHTSIIMQRGNAAFDLGWRDVIYKPALDKLVGEIDFNCAKGQIVDIGEDAAEKMSFGQILTLLDINRFIMLNFFDLANKGYSFDKMIGSVNLYNGQVSTKSFYFDGHVARIDIFGNMNLKSQNLNLKLEVTPYITASVPVVAGVVGGPVVGVAAFVANKVFGKMIDKLVTYNYLVTGDISKPIVESIKTV